MGSPGQVIELGERPEGVEEVRDAIGHAVHLMWRGVIVATLTDRDRCSMLGATLDWNEVRRTMVPTEHA